MGITGLPFSIVVGYIPDVDRLSRTARDLALGYRYAFVMSTYSPFSPDMVFDAGLYREIAVSIWDLLGSERAEVVMDYEQPRMADNLADFTARVEEFSLSEDEPVSRIIMYRGSAPVGFLESEPYARVGGPRPYHDSYTVAVYTSSDVSDLLVARGQELAGRCNSDLEEVIRCEVVRMDTQLPPSFWSLLKAAVWPPKSP